MIQFAFSSLRALSASSAFGYSVIVASGNRLSRLKTVDDCAVCASDVLKVTVRLLLL